MTDAAADRSAVVSVEPWGLRLDVRPGETVLDAAFRHGWRWPTNCYGQARCTVCHVTVLDGADVVDPPNDAEAVLLARIRRILYRDDAALELRLACQLRPRGDLRLALRTPPAST